MTLLREEMRRIIRYLDWQAAEWDTRAALTGSREDLPTATLAGIEAYAHKQAHVHRELREFFWDALNMSVGDATAAASSVEDGADLNALFTQGTSSAPLFLSGTGADLIFAG